MAQQPIAENATAKPRFTVAKWSAFWAKPDAAIAARAGVQAASLVSAGSR